MNINCYMVQVFVSASSLWSIPRGSVDYGALPGVINTLITTQAQGLAHLAVIILSPADCSLQPWLCNPLKRHRAEGKQDTWLKIIKNIRKSSVVVVVVFFKERKTVICSYR